MEQMLEGMIRMSEGDRIMMDLPKSRVFNAGLRPVNHEVDGNVLCAGNADGSLKLDPWFIFDTLDLPWVTQMQRHLNPEDHPKTHKLKAQVQEVAMAICAKQFEEIGAASTDEERAEARKTYNETLEKTRLKIYKHRVYPNPCQLVSLQIFGSWRNPSGRRGSQGASDQDPVSRMGSVAWKVQTQARRKEGDAP